MTVEDALIWLLAGVAWLVLLLGLMQTLFGWPSRRPPLRSRDGRDALNRNESSRGGLSTIQGADPDASERGGATSGVTVDSRRSGMPSVSPQVPAGGRGKSP